MIRQRRPQRIGRTTVNEDRNTRESSTELNNRNNLKQLFLDNPIPDEDITRNLGLFMSRIDIGKFLFTHEVYLRSKHVHGCIAEFGVRYGTNLAWLLNLRSIYEPYNYTRSVYGFDTFTGLSGRDQKDGANIAVKENNFSTPENYDDYLDKILDCHENEAPISHMPKYKIIVGDVRDTLALFLDHNPHVIFSLLYFDLDLYQPTKSTLELIEPRIGKNCVIAFDQLNHSSFPGETVAFREFFGLGDRQIYRTNYHPSGAYILY